MARLYANENFPRQVVEELRQLGHDVVTIQETGKAGQAMPDEHVLAFAAADDRAVLSLNRRHFIRLHNAGNVMPALLHARSTRISWCRRGESMRASNLRAISPANCCA